tara:strand:- start:3360 stop:4196 length:837 start_codon:yes stop_codon:yes gene_type:complete
MIIGMETKRPIIIVGKEGTEKKEQAIAFFDDPIVKYANEYDIVDNYSIPIDRGIVILEANFKPQTDLIVDTLLKYRGDVVLTSANQKDVPKKIFSLCKLKRAGKSKLQAKLKLMAPNSDEPEDYFKNVFEITHDFLKNKDRDDVALKLKLNKPPDVQLLSWLTANIHPNKLAYIDAKVKRRWSQDYFYELLAYSHNGTLARSAIIPSKRAYDRDAQICRKVGLKSHEKYILEQLKQDPVFVKYMKTKLNNVQKRRAKIPDRVSKRKKKDKQLGLDNWM